MAVQSLGGEFSGRVEPAPAPLGYRGAISLGANWSIGVGVYLLLSVVGMVALGGLPIVSGDVAQTIEIAGASPIRFGTIVMLDALFHGLFFVTAATLFAILRERWPVRAALVLVGGAWQMILGLTKGFSTVLTFTSLGSAYLGAEPAVKSVLLAVATGEYGLRLALQAMDGFGVMLVWIVLSLLPATSDLPRGVRWLGWIMALALLGATPQGPTFLLVPLTFPIWAYLVARWMKAQ